MVFRSKHAIIWSKKQMNIVELLVNILSDFKEFSNLSFHKNVISFVYKQEIYFLNIDKRKVS